MRKKVYLDRIGRFIVNYYSPKRKEEEGYRKDLGSISPTFYVQLLCTKIPEVPKD